MYKVHIYNSGEPRGSVTGLSATVLDADSTPYVISNEVLDPSGASYFLRPRVRDADGTEYVIFS